MCGENLLTGDSLLTPKSPYHLLLVIRVVLETVRYHLLSFARRMRVKKQ